MASSFQLICGIKAWINLLKLNFNGNWINIPNLVQVRDSGLLGVVRRELNFRSVRKDRQFFARASKSTIRYKEISPTFWTLRRFIAQKPVTITYLLLPFPLKVLLTPVSCEDLMCDCVCCSESNSDIKCPCKSCSPPSPPYCPPITSPPCPPTSPCPPISNPKPVCPDEPNKMICSETKIDSAVRWCEPQQLSHKVLVRQACQVTVDSVTRILGEIISAYQDYHIEYRCLMDKMMDALECIRSAQGIQAEVLDCKLIMIRASVEDMRRSIVELESFMSSVQKLADAAAETAYLGHAEYHSICMCERMQSAVTEMKQIREESLRKERDMMELQSVVIVESGKSLK